MVQSLSVIKISQPYDLSIFIRPRELIYPTTYVAVNFRVVEKLRFWPTSLHQHILSIQILLFLSSTYE